MIAAIVLLLAVLASSRPAIAADELVAYPVLPGATASTNYTVRANGKSLFVERFGDVSVVRFAFIGRVQVEITSSAGLASAVLSPRAEGILTTVADKTLAFALQKPGKLILQVAGAEKLLLLVDGPERQARLPGQTGVVNLHDYLVAGRNPLSPVTADLQKAIDETAARGGGTGGILYVPDGLYRSAQLRLRSNVELYLAPGAMIQAVPEFNKTHYPVQHGADSSFIYIPQASNVRIAGRGVIDGNGFVLRSNAPGSGNVKLLRSVGSRGLVIEDVFFRDSARWSLHFLHSDDVHVSQIKLVNDLRVMPGQTLPLVSNTDGVDIDASTFVTVEDSFIYTTDDAFSPKVTGYMGLSKPAHDIYIRNNVIWTQKCALKVGSEVLRDIYGVRFENNDVILADRLVALWNEGGSVIRTIAATHNRTETIGVLDNRALLYFFIRNKPGLLHDIEINGIQALTRAPGESRMEGFDDTHRVSNVAVRNLYVAGAAVHTAKAVPIVARNAFVSDVVLTPPGADGPPTVIVAASDDTGVEGQDSLQFSFVRAGSLDAPLTVNYQLAGSAVAGLDYPVAASSITIPAGAQRAELVVTPRADLLAEDAETLTLNLTDSAAYRIGASRCALGAIVDRPASLSLEGLPAAPSVSVTVADGSSSESQTVRNGGRFLITRSGALDRELVVRVRYAGTATPGADYPEMPRQVTLPAGKSSIPLVVMPIQDCMPEKHEKLTLELEADPAYRVALGSGTLTILNVDP